MADSDKPDKNANEPPKTGDAKKDTPESKRTFQEGVVDGFVETVVSPFRWTRGILGGGGGTNKD